MPLDAKNYGPGMPIYSYVVAGTGENIHIDSELLRLWCLEQQKKGLLEVFNTPVSLKQADSFLSENVIDASHAISILGLKSWDPIIYCKYGTSTNGAPDVMLVDGHHRYWCAAKMGMKWAPAFVLEREQWQEFQILGMPDISEELLRVMPPRGGAGR